MRNFKRKFIAIMTSVFCFAALIPAVPAMADGQKVVTLGADLSEDQQITMLKYFGVYGEPVETLFINNTEEREHLAAYVPLEQIGTRTVSCAMVNPTSSGGIKVKTANLTWVTGSMIAQTLSTSGIKNCEVIAAAPFAVSGTGALTGIMMAYETASGEELDEAKKDAATQELVATATIAGDIGEETATQIVNDVKVQVIEGDVNNTTEIQEIINNTAEDLQVSLSDEDRELLQSLLEKVSEIDYDEDEVDAMKGVTEDEDSSASDDSSSDNDEDSSGSILDNTNDDVFGDDTVFTDSTEPAADEDEDNNDEEASGSGLDNDGFETFDSDEFDNESEGTTEEPEVTTEEPNEGTAEEGTVEEPETGVTETGEFSVSELVLTPNVTEGEIEMGILPEDEEVSEEAAPGLNCLTVQSEMTDLVAGSGEIFVYDADDDAEPIATIEMKDEDHVVSQPIDDEEVLKDLDWEEGIEFRIILDDPLEAGKSYYVVLSEDAFETADGTMISAASEKDDWTFDTAEYGISVVETVEGIKTGEEVTVNLYMDPEADYADIEYSSSDGTISEYVNQYYKSGQFTLTFDQTGEITVTASFYANAAEEEPEVFEETEESDEFSGFVEDIETFAEPISEAEYTVTVK